MRSHLRVSFNEYSKLLCFDSIERKAKKAGPHTTEKGATNMTKLATSRKIAPIEVKMEKGEFVKKNTHWFLLLMRNCQVIATADMLILEQ